MNMLDRSAGNPSQEAPGVPVWGRAALATFLGVLLTFVLGALNVLAGGSWAALIAVAILGGTTCAIQSLRKREPRTLAIVTLLLTVALPGLLWVRVGFMRSFG